MLMYLRLAEDIFPSNVELSHCNHCNSTVMDSLGRHSLSCGTGATNRSSRHKEVNFTLFSGAIAAKIRAFKEDDTVAVGYSADLSLLHIDEDNKNVVVDVNIPNPFCSSNIMIYSRSPKGFEKLLNDNAKFKRNDRPGKAFAAQRNTNFYPFILDALGNIHEDALQVINLIASKSAARTGYPFSSCVNRISRKILSQLWYYNSRMLWHRYRAISSDED